MDADTNARLAESILEETDLWAQAKQALIRSSDGVAPKHEEVALEDDHPEFPRIETGVSNAAGEELKIQGVTVIAADPGSGKSVLATQIAFFAAMNGMLVVLHDAENDAGLLKKRAARYFGRDGFQSQFVERFSQQTFRYFPFLPKHVKDDIIGSTLKAIGFGHGCHGLLIILDSLQSIARGIDERNQFQVANDLMRWANGLARTTHGFISTLVLSETNAGGKTYGRTSVFTANVSLELRNEEEERGEDSVSIWVNKYRDGRSRYEFGKFVRHWQQNVFLPDNPLRMPTAKVP